MSIADTHEGYRRSFLDTLDFRVCRSFYVLDEFFLSLSLSLRYTCVTLP